MAVGKTSRQEQAKRKRRLKITQAKASALLAKKQTLHPVAAAIVEAVAAKEIEEVVIYAAPEPPPAAKKSWWHDFWD